MVAARKERVGVWQGRVGTEVEIRGSGPPVVFLHGPWGLATDGGFLDALAEAHTVYAPRHPGTSPGEPDAVHLLDDWLDLIVYHGELLDRLGLRTVSIVGHSFGGMVAAELAAALPERVGKLVLIDALGLWREDRPVRNWMIVSDEERRRLLFAAPEGDAAREFFSLPSDAEARAETLASFIWAQACTGKFVWPIPDRGLGKRIHRIGAPTLIVWGRQDGVISPEYAADLSARIAGSRVELVEGAGHLPHLERPSVVAGLIRAFLAA